MCNLVFEYDSLYENLIREEGSPSDLDGLQKESPGGNTKSHRRSNGHVFRTCHVSFHVYTRPW
jgi:hypothetical protein